MTGTRPRLRGLCLSLLCIWAVGCDRRRVASAEGELLAQPSSLDFSRVAMYRGADLQVTLRNIGRGQLMVASAEVEGSDGHTYSVAFTQPSTRVVDPDGTNSLVVSFRPEDAGPLSGTLVIRSDNPSAEPIRIPLRGVGVDARAVVDASNLDFGRIEAESKKTLSLEFRNISDLPIQVASQVIGHDQDEFAVPSFPLGAYEQKRVDVTFSPQRVGIKDAGLDVTPCVNCPKTQVAIRAEALDRAIIAEPWSLDFGQVAIDRDAHLTARLHNISTEPMVLTGKQLGAGTDASFSFPLAPFPLILGPDAVADFDVRYTPGHMGTAGGTAVFDEISVRNPRTEVALTAFGGAPELCISPESYDYGTVPLGSKNVATITVENCGSSNEAPLQINGISIGGDGISGEEMFSFVAPARPIVLHAGASVRVRAFYEPTREGEAGAYLHFDTSIYGAHDVRVGLSGRAKGQALCDLEITPMAVDFGTVPPGWGAVLGVKLKNRGLEVCAVKNILLRDDGGGVFLLPGGDIDGMLIWPGDYFTWEVAFIAPASGGSFQGLLQIQSGDPGHPEFLVPLTANSQESCLVATPNFLDFGVVRPDCPPDPRQVIFSNSCDTPLSLSSIQIGPGTTDGEFTIRSLSPQPPLTLAPGDHVTATIGYGAQTPGLNLSPLFAGASGLAAPLEVSLVGESSTTTRRTDNFVQQDGSKVDVLFVVDNTASMVEEQPRLVAAMPAFASAALARGVDLHAGVTTTGIDPVSDACPGGAQGGEAGRLFPADNSNLRILTNATPDLAAELQQDVWVGQCAFLEQGLEAMQLALSPPLVDHADDPRTPLPNDGNLGFLRASAALAVVFVGDEDDHSPESVQTYVNFLRTVKGTNQPQRAVIYAIAPTDVPCPTAGGTGTRYADAARLTGGDVLSICAADYSPLLTEVADKAFSPQSRFPLSAQADPGAITVTVDGVVLTSGWHYDAATNSIVFDQTPAAGAHITVQYRISC